MSFFFISSALFIYRSSLYKMKFACSCVDKCIRASNDVLDGKLSGKRHLVEKLNAIIYNLRLALTIMDMRTESPEEFDGVSATFFRE